MGDGWKLVAFKTPCEDERGVEGVLILPNEGNNKKKVRVGTKLSASTVKRSEFDNSAARDALHERESAALQIEANSQERNFIKLPRNSGLFQIVSPG